MEPSPGFEGKAYVGEVPAILGGSWTGWGSPRPRRASGAQRCRRGAVTDRLRDWLFSRQRYWGEPFPLVYDETGLPVALSESMLPVELPEVADFSPNHLRPGRRRLHTRRLHCLSRNPDWSRWSWTSATGPRGYTRQASMMPQCAGSCWFELSYLDPSNDETLVDPANERYWMRPRDERHRLPVMRRVDPLAGGPVP